MIDGNQSFDPGRVATAPVVGLDATKQFLRYQASMFRLWADNCELMARNYEKSLEEFNSAKERRREAA
jgi:hypothetical protein